MQHLTQPPSRFLRPFLIALCLALGSLLAAGAPAGASHPPTQKPLVPPKDATLGVALAQIATVRIEAHYTLSFTPSSGPQTPFTLSGVCSGLGALIASTDPKGAGVTYLLTTSQVLTQTFCQTPQLPNATFKSTTFEGANVYLSTAYAGAKAGMPIGTFTIAKAVKDNLPPTNGTPVTPVLVPLTAPSGATLHDYPTISLPASSINQPSRLVALDMQNKDAQPLNQTQLNSFVLPGTPPPTPSAQAKDYLVPVEAPSTSTTLSPGAPLIDPQTGFLTGLAVPGNTPILKDAIETKLSTLTPKPACPGDTQCLSARWQQAMNAFYSSNRASAAPLLQAISASYPDFEGAQEFLAASAPAQTVTPGPSATATNQKTSESPLFGQPEIIIILLAVLVGLFLLVILMAFLIYVQKSRKRQKREQAAAREAAAERSQPFMPRTPSGQLAQASFVASSSGAGPQVAPGAPTLPYAPSMQNLAQSGRTITCTHCGAPNNAGSSVCFNCGHDLAQAPGVTSGGRGAFAPSTSGGPARLNLPSLSQPPVSQPPMPAAAPDPAAQAPQPPGGHLRAAYQGENQDTEPAIPALSRSEDRTVVLPGRKRPAFGVMVSSRTDRGRKRAGKENEDNYLAVTGTRLHNGQIEPFGLFVVADGMGGHANGQDASRMTIESIFLDLAPRLTKQEIPDDELTTLLQQAVQNANQKLYRQNQQDHSDMGCTMTAALIAGNEAHICNVGDSRTYLLHPGGKLERVTVDHSIVQSLVDAGVIQKDDVYTHPKRNQIYRSLGEKEVIEIDTFRQPVAPGDKLLLCCDGLWEMIRDNEIELILSQTEDLPQASAKLIEMANEHGGVDNITAIVVKVTEPGKPPRRPGIESVDSGPASLPNKRAVG